MRRYQAMASGCADAKLHDISETGMDLMEGQSEQCRELPGQVLWVRQHIPHPLAVPVLEGRNSATVTCVCSDEGLRSHVCVLVQHCNNREEAGMFTLLMRLG